MLIDSHCHLDFPELAGDLSGVLSRASQAGVALVQTIGTRLSRFSAVRALAEGDPRIYCSVGIHPHNVAEEEPATTDGLLALSRHPKVIGIGETGLDFHYDYGPRDLQATSFRKHIAAARESGLPLIVHSRAADQETIAILRDEAAQGAFPGVIHCFTAGPALAAAAVDLGLYISFSGILTFKNAANLRDIARTLPIERILVETDAPYLAPVPHRGRPNEPAFVALTARLLAELRGMSTEAMAQATTENFFRLFSKVSRKNIEIT